MKTKILLIAFIIFHSWAFAQLDDTQSTDNGAMTLGTGSGTLYQFAGDQRGTDGTNQSQGGFGILSGSNQISPIIWMYGYGGKNAFQVRKKGYAANVQNGTTLFHVGVDGNVGIGTTSPQYMVHAKRLTGISEVRTESYDHYARMGTNDGGGYLGASNGNGELTINIRGYGDAYFNAGNVGIGTTIPDAKLTVKGNIHAEEVKVDLSVPGPDYVFKEDYDLKSLEEVQNYIKTNGHLPNIPSAQEMEENGIQLGEMNMKLLEKIEELTLYTLEQEEKIQDYKVELAVERRVNKEQERRLSKLEELLIEK
nr:tail fiber protein [uncultured Allomuricauda sp.]